MTKILLINLKLEKTSNGKMKIESKLFFSDNLSKLSTSTYYQMTDFESKMIEMKRDTYYPYLPSIMSLERFKGMDKEYRDDGKTKLLSEQEEKEFLEKLNEQIKQNCEFTDVKNMFVNFAELEYLNSRK